MGQYTQFTMRIDSEVYALVKDSAERNKRSIAKEIEFILEQWCNPSRSIESTAEVRKAARELLQALKNSDT